MSVASHHSIPLRLRVYPAAVLRQQAQPFTQFGTQAETLARGMLELMRRKRGIGLAAPQVGLLVRLLVADIGDDVICLANPELTALPGVETACEGCLSLPGIEMNIERAQMVEVSGFDLAGRALRFTARGLLARVLQHEADHLNGILIIDRASPVTAVNIPETLNTSDLPKQPRHPSL